MEPPSAPGRKVPIELSALVGWTLNRTARYHRSTTTSTGMSSFWAGPRTPLHAPFPSICSPSEVVRYHAMGAQIGHCAHVTIRDPDLGEPMMLTVYQAYEAAYRFVARYCRREPVEPLMLMMVAMEPKGDHYVTDDPASWSDWQRCLQETLHGAPIPKPRAPIQLHQLFKGDT